MPDRNDALKLLHEWVDNEGLRTHMRCVEAAGRHYARLRGADEELWGLAGLAVLSGVCLGLDLAVWHRAILWIGAGLATVLANTQVIFVGLAAWVFQGERPGRPTLVAVPIAFAGMAMVSGLGRDDAYGENPLLGTFFGLLAGIAYASFLLLFRRSSRDEATPYGPFLLATLGTVAVTGAVGGVSGQLDLAVSWPAHGWLLAMAMGSQVGGWLCIAYALPRLPAVETSILLLLQPMITVLWARLLFREALSVVQWSGVLLVLAGVALPTLGALLGSGRVAASDTARPGGPGEGRAGE